MLLPSQKQERAKCAFLRRFIGSLLLLAITYSIVVVDARFCGLKLAEKLSGVCLDQLECSHYSVEAESATGQCFLVCFS